MVVVSGEILYLINKCYAMLGEFRLFLVINIEGLNIKSVLLEVDGHGKTHVTESEESNSRGEGITKLPCESHSVIQKISII